MLEERGALVRAHGKTQRLFPRPARVLEVTTEFQEMPSRNVEAVVTNQRLGESLFVEKCESFSGPPREANGDGPIHGDDG
jgi:hypothetical protein